IAVIVAVVGGGWAYVTYRDQQAQSQLGAAIEKYNAPVRPPDTPATPDMLSFASSEERAKVSNAEFTRIADKYSFTQSGRVARYLAGITFHDMGDNAAAEKDLKDVAGSRYKEVASLAKLALAGIYHDTNRDPQAIALYKDLADHPTASVGKSTAQFLLASLYEESHQPDRRARSISRCKKKARPVQWRSLRIGGCKRSSNCKHSFSLLALRFLSLSSRPRALARAEGPAFYCHPESL